MGKNSTNPIEWIVAIIIGILIVSSVPYLSNLVGQIFGAILTILVLGIILGLIILAIWYFFFNEGGSYRY